MSKTRSKSRKTPLGRAKGFVAATSLPALSKALLDRGIDPHAILAIEIQKPAMARVARPEFRVLYEAR